MWEQPPVVDQGQLGGVCGCLWGIVRAICRSTGILGAEMGQGGAGEGWQHGRGALAASWGVQWCVLVPGDVRPPRSPQRDVALGQPCSIRTWPHTPAFNPKITYFGGLSVGLPAPGWVVAPGAAGSTGSPSSWPHSGRLGRGGQLSANNSKLQQCEAQVMLKAPPRQPRAERQENLLGAVWVTAKSKIGNGGSGPNRLERNCLRSGCASNHSITSLSPPISTKYAEYYHAEIPLKPSRLK